MTKSDRRWGSFPIIGSGQAKEGGRLEALLKVSLRETGEEAGIIHKFAEDRYLALAYERGADGSRGALHPVKECSSFSDAANALRRDYLNRAGGRSRYLQS